MVLLGDVGEVEARFSPFRNSVNLDTRLCMVCTERTIGLEIVGMHMMALLADVFKWRLVSVSLEKVLGSTQERCTICAKRTTGSEISLDAPDGTPR